MSLTELPDRQLEIGYVCEASFVRGRDRGKQLLDLVRMQFPGPQ